MYVIAVQVIRDTHAQGGIKYYSIIFSVPISPQLCSKKHETNEETNQPTAERPPQWMKE